MNTKALKQFLKLYKFRLILVAIGVVFICLVIYILILGVNSYMTLESFYKKMMLAGIPIQLLFSIVTAFIFATIYIFGWFYMLYGGGMARLGQKKVRSKEVNVQWDDVVGMEAVKSEVSEVIKLINDRIRLKRVGGNVINVSASAEFHQ